MSEPRVLFVRCVLVRIVPRMLVSADSTIVQCAKCSRDVYLSKSSRALVSEKNATVICNECSEKIGPYFELPMTQAQQTELRENIERIHNN